MRVMVLGGLGIVGTTVAGLFGPWPLALGVAVLTVVLVAGSSGEAKS